MWPKFVFGEENADKIDAFNFEDVISQSVVIQECAETRRISRDARLELSDWFFQEDFGNKPLYIGLENEKLGISRPI